MKTKTEMKSSDFTHSVCPERAKKLYPEFDLENVRRET